MHYFKIVNLHYRFIRNRKLWGINYFLQLFATQHFAHWLQHRHDSHSIIFQENYLKVYTLYKSHSSMVTAITSYFTVATCKVEVMVRKKNSEEKLAN